MSYTIRNTFEKSAVEMRKVYTDTLIDMARKNDVALGIANMVAETIAMLAVFAARSFCINTVVLTGNLTTLKPITEVFEGLEDNFGEKFIIPELSQFATVIGAALCEGEN